MLLDRIDIDEHGPLNRVELGPLGEQLNVVFAPIGSGKTAIARFVRDTLVDRQYPTGMMSSSTGRVVWATRGGMLVCHREQDGTRQGRRSIHFEPRGTVEPQFDAVQSSWLDSVASSQAVNRSLEAIELPESIVDGVITDTAVTNVARVVASCLQHGLDRMERYHRLPMAEPAISVDAEDRGSRRAELSRIESELARIGRIECDYSALVARRNALSSQLAGWYQTDRMLPHHHPGHHDRLRHRSQELHARARHLRSRQSELRSWIVELERKLDSRRAYGESVSEVNEQLIRSRRNLRDLTNELDACLADASEARKSMRWTDGRAVWTDRDAIVRELRELDDQLATWSRRDWLLSRQHQLRQQLGHHTVSRPTYRVSPLASVAGEWLLRVSGGRLSRIDWTSQSVHGTQQRRNRVNVRINNRHESEFSACDRALAALAVRLAAGQLLASTGRHVPLVIETQREMWQDQQRLHQHAPYETDYYQAGELYRYNHPLVAALHDYAAAGRQVVVMTSDQPVVTELSRSGARSFDIHPRRIVHGHQPLWQPHYDHETYVGPHPHTVGERDVVHATVVSPTGSVEAVNRDFDLASHHIYDEAPAPIVNVPPTSTVVTDRAANDVRYRDGYYYADTYTTVEMPANATTSSRSCDACCGQGRGSTRSIEKPKSPFLLSVDSPVDQAPSIDAVAAARLRGLDVTHVTHLMQHDANRLADALGMATVDAATIRRWQAESRLCCRVPQLRNFDARILVGCGITTPAQLAAIHPTDLLREVEEFLTTERGQRILRSGTSQELARITTWIATANSGLADSGTLQGEVVRRSAAYSASMSEARRSRLSETTAEDDIVGFGFNTRRQHQNNRQRTRRGGRATAASYAATGDASRRSSAEGSTRRRRSSRSTGTNGQRTTTSTGQRERRGKRPRQPQNDVVRYEQHREGTAWRFYLQRDSPVEDAPSIGARMAERLGTIGVITVNDLLQADPDSVAENLNHRRVTAETVVEWQQQATLVCCVPMLRGHDAQLLVAAEITTPETLAQCDADELLALIDPISRSTQGKRILRGGRVPDLAEVTDWIGFAQHTRELKAA